MTASSLSFSQFHKLRRVKKLTSSLFSKYQGDKKANPDEPVRSPPATLLRIWLRSPWDDYSSVRISGKSLLVNHKEKHFLKATIRTYLVPGNLEILQYLSKIQHPNIIPIYDLYYYEDKLFVVTEYLELSLSELDFLNSPLEEWEIATIAAEVVRGLAYLIPTGISCEEISLSSVRLSIYGDVKIGLDIERINQANKGEPALTASPLLFLFKMVEEMILPRYYPESDNEVWSQVILEFLSCCASDPVESLVKHPFLDRAAPTTKLAPRIRSTTELRRIIEQGSV